ncbi:MAG TPA: four helix bundle protein [Chryseosolibacter sp.]
MAFKFEKLNVWQRSLDFSVEVYELTNKFPKQEMFGLTSQINRAADSISLNIAEGSTGQSNAEFSKFLGYSIRSGIEVVGCLYIAKKKKFITQDEFNYHYTAAESIIVMNQALRKKLR